MQKTSIGKTQLIIGIIILIIGIVGIICSIMLFNRIRGEMLPGITLQEGDTINDPGINLDFINLLVILECALLSTSIILIFLSILFITQGLGKLAEE
jgi:hypothetical protein